MSENKQPKKLSSTLTATQLLALKEETERYLLEPVLPKIGTGVLVGRPDTGKSQFARQFCLSVANGDTDFLGFKLHLIQKKALYLATEDDHLNTRHLLGKQVTEKTYNTDNLKFVFADLMTTKEIIATLHKELKKDPVDLIIVDAFGDVFQGVDSNNNTAMRNTAKAFDKVAKQYNCFLLFVHHINKAAYDQAPNQKHIQGGSGLAQKVRSAIQLSVGPGRYRYLSVTKGNYCPQDVKENAFELEFNEQTFSFSFTGNRIDPSNLSSDKKEKKEEEKLQTLINLSELVFMDQDELTYKEMTSRIEKLTSKGVATAKRYIRSMTDVELIQKDKTTKQYTLSKEEPDT